MDTETSSEPTPSPAKKWWWIPAVAVPIVVAVIAVLGDWFRPGGDSGDGFVIGEITFNSPIAVRDQAREEVPPAVLDSVLEIARQADESLRSDDFARAIRAYRSLLRVVTVPALYNNIGAAYLAMGEQDSAFVYFSKASGDETVRSNLGRLPPVPLPELRLVTFTSQWEDGFGYCSLGLLGSCAEYIIDGNPNRGWMSRNARFPQSFVVELPREFLVSVVSFDNTPRGELNTATREVRISVSVEGPSTGFQEVLRVALEPQQIAQGFELPSEAPARWIKLDILSNHGNGETTELSEFRVLGRLPLDGG